MQLSVQMNSNRLQRWLTWWPRPVQRFATWIGAAVCFVGDVRGCRSSLVPLAREALSVSTWRAALVSLRVRVASFSYALDSLTILSGNPRTVDKINRTRNTWRGIDNLEEALAKGRGVIVTASQFSCLYYAMMCRWPESAGLVAKVPFSLVVPKKDPLFLDIYAKVREYGGQPFDLIPMDSQRAGLDMLRALRGGGVVICMIDNIPQDTAVVASPLFGRPACLPAGYLVLAQRYGIPIVGSNTLCRDGSFCTTFDRPIYPEDCTEDDVVGWLAARIHERLEVLVREHPGDWISWESVPAKWGLGNALQNLG